MIYKNETYISTPKFETMPKTGELWYIKFEDVNHLITMEIGDITTHTVKLNWIYQKDMDYSGRFITDSIHFVEESTNQKDIDALNGWKK